MSTTKHVHMQTEYSSSERADTSSHATFHERLRRTLNAMHRARTLMESDAHPPLLRFRGLISAAMTLRCCTQSLAEGVTESLVNSWLDPGFLKESDATAPQSARHPSASERLRTIRRCESAGLVSSTQAARVLIERSSLSARKSRLFEKGRFVTISRQAAQSYLEPMILGLGLSSEATKELSKWVATSSESETGSTTLLVFSAGPELWSARWLRPLSELSLSESSITDVGTFTCEHEISLIERTESYATRRSEVTMGTFAPPVPAYFVGRHGSVDIGFLADASLIGVGWDECDEQRIRRGWSLAEVLADIR